MELLFRDRADAGIRLAQLVQPLAGPEVVVAGLPRGGLPVAAEVARALGAPLDVLVVRKLGCPGFPELGIGAVGEGGVRHVNSPLVQRLELSPEAVDEVARLASEAIDGQVARYRHGRPAVGWSGKFVIVVDDGLATGFTARAAISVLRDAGARHVVLAVPVGPIEALEEVRAVADAVYAIESPADFYSIGEWYVDFREVTDEDVERILAESAPLPA